MIIGSKKILKKINDSPQVVAPEDFKFIYETPAYVEGAKEILFSYTPEDVGYEGFIDEPNRLVAHKDYRIKNFRFKDPGMATPKHYNYTFGLRHSLQNTRFVALDFDNVAPGKVIDLALQLSQAKEVEAMDLLFSNFNQKSMHMVLGFDKFYDVRSVLHFTPNLCPGYLKFCTTRGEGLIRISQKFNYLTSELKESNIAPTLVWRKELDSFILDFSKLQEKIPDDNEKLNLRRTDEDK